MDEPVEFNTDFIYQYGSDFITSFGGEEDGMFDIDTITWNQSDIPEVLHNLAVFSQQNELPEIKFENYSKNKDGTYKLQSDLIQSDMPKQYILGCLIYHQLQYTNELVATFLTGEPNMDYYSE